MAEGRVQLRGRMAAFWGFLVLLACWCLLVLLTGLSIGPEARAGEWRALEARGFITVQEPSKEARRLKVGESIPAGALLSTGADGRATLSDGRDVLNVLTNSRVRIPVSSQGVETKFFQYFGRVRYKVGERNKGSFSVDSPLLAAVVKGTVFEVEVGQGRDRVLVSEGVVAVASKIDARTALLNRGQSISVSSVEAGTPAADTKNATLKGLAASDNVVSSTSGRDSPVPPVDPSRASKVEQSLHKNVFNDSKIFAALVVGVLGFSVVVAYSISHLRGRPRTILQKEQPRWRAFSEISGDNNGRDVTVIVTDGEGAPVSGLRFVASLRQVREPAKRLNVTLTPSRPGVYVGTLGRLEAGHWQLEGHAYRGDDKLAFSRRHSLL